MLPPTELQQGNHVNKLQRKSSNNERQQHQPNNLAVVGRTSQQRIIPTMEPHAQRRKKANLKAKSQPKVKCQTELYIKAMQRRHCQVAGVKQRWCFAMVWCRTGWFEAVWVDFRLFGSFDHRRSRWSSSFSTEYDSSRCSVQNNMARLLLLHSLVVVQCETTMQYLWFLMSEFLHSPPASDCDEESKLQQMESTRSRQAPAPDNNTNISLSSSIDQLPTANNQQHP